MGLALGADCRSGAFTDLLDEAADSETEAKLDELLKRRLKGEPLQYIIGEWEFYGIRLKVGSGVLIPRQDTELMLEILEQRFKNAKGLRVIDLCAGSGCIAIAAEKRLECSDVCGVEKSPEAIGYFRQNVEMNGSQVKIIEGDVLDTATLDLLPEADIITCNPPYLSDEDMRSLQKEVSFEPAMALYGGEDGLDFYRAVTRLWKTKLAEGGMLIYEIGLGREDEVMAAMIQHGFKNVRCVKDYGGIFRCVWGIKG